MGEEKRTNLLEKFSAFMEHDTRGEEVNLVCFDT